MSTPSDKPPRRSSGGTPADPAARPSRRRFTAEYKLALVAEYENAPNGQKGAILRREGLYSSHVIEWTRARDAGRLGGGPAESTASATPARRTAEQIDLEKLRRQNEKLTSDPTRTRMALDIMGKAHALLRELSESADEDRPHGR
ncbi:transposase [Actinosynnema sp. CS-041913]|uniref:transposase n=1 Tax=Actinosynnema sp. CS-041913 TaxID=3239917 RepID=UPI003D9366DA